MLGPMQAGKCRRRVTWCTQQWVPAGCSSPRRCIAMLCALHVYVKWQDAAHEGCRSVCNTMGQSSHGKMMLRWLSVMPNGCGAQSVNMPGWSRFIPCRATELSTCMFKYW